MKIKKVLSLLVVFCLFLSIAPISAFAEDCECIERKCCFNRYDANIITDYSTINPFTKSVLDVESCQYDEKNDGRIWLDRSVTTDNEYNYNNKNIENGNIDVILSMQAQNYKVKSSIELPVDVVFVVDASSSMMQCMSSSSNRSKAEASINSINAALECVMKNEKSRASIVTVGEDAPGYARVLMSMNHYNPVRNKFVSFGSDGRIIREVKDPHAEVNYTDFSGTTNFQIGIYKAYEVMKKSASSAGSNVPIVIFLTDGVPIWYTPRYDNDKVMKSSIISEDYWQTAVLKTRKGNTNCGAQATTPLASYYSILTANYYKDKISKEYNKDAYFSTIGLLDQATVEKKTERYIETMLNPTYLNVAKCKGDTTELYFESVTRSIFGNLGKFVKCPLLTPDRLYECLTCASDKKSKYDEFNIVVKDSGKIKTIPKGSYKIKANPYLKKGYDYSDTTYIGQPTEEELTEIFTHIIEYNVEKNPIDILNDKVVVYDELPKEVSVVSEEMILRVNGTNYIAKKKNNLKQTNEEQFICNSECPSPKGYNVDLSGCNIKVIKNDETGSQIVRFEVPRNLLDLCTLNIDKGFINPIRLIYTIQPNKSLGAGNYLLESKAYAEFTPARDNIYYYGMNRSIGYDDIQYKIHPITNERINPSGSSLDYTYKTTFNENKPNTILGNNARIILSGKNIIITKEWLDDNDRDRIRPKSIVINLFNNNGLVESKEVTSDDGWQCVFENLALYDDQDQPMNYYITEDYIEGYDVIIEGNNVRNIHNPETIEISGVKKWQGDISEDEIPEAATIYLLANGEIIDTKIITKSDNWMFSWSNMVKYKDGNEIEYTIKEENIEGYTTDYEGYDIINTKVESKPNVSDTIISHIIKTGDKTPFTMLIVSSITSISIVLFVICYKKIIRSN